MIREFYINNVLRERWNDDVSPRVVTFFDAAGAQTSQRQYTAAENAEADARAAAATAEANRLALEAKARTAQQTNATFLAIASPTTAQATTQVKALTRQVNALIKLAVKDLADQNGT